MVDMPWDLCYYGLLNGDEIMVYTTYLLNFGFTKYEGPSLDEAKQVAVDTGFECVIYEDGKPILARSALGGWRNLQIQSMG